MRMLNTVNNKFKISEKWIPKNQWKNLFPNMFQEFYFQIRSLTSVLEIDSVIQAEILLITKEEYCKKKQATIRNRILLKIKWKILHNRRVTDYYFLISLDLLYGMILEARRLWKVIIALSQLNND